ncbi:hypothetical protein LPJ63_004266 [Coemansia sp. RSA 2711]|nr:hypothetical protein LPJ63_004266 [Coemansia sp. RSA 2711]
MSLSLVPDYGSSSSDSDSDTESKLTGKQLQTNDALPGSGLGSKLSSILPPPKNSGSSEKRRIQIMVDLPPPQHNQKPEPENNIPVSAGAPGNTGKIAGGGMFAELSSMLPAPKNAKPMAKRRPEAPISAASTATTSLPAKSNIQQSLIPHSLSNKRKAKGKSASKPVDFHAKAVGQQLPAADAADASSDTKPAGVAASSKPFFTFAADEPDSVQHAAGSDSDGIDEPAATDKLTATDGQVSEDSQPTLVYDPTSGYYYDGRNGVYYYYDASSGSYIDAQTLYQPDEHTDDPSAIDNAVLERLIGRDNIAGARIQSISQTQQLADSGYSDAQAGAEFSAKRAALQQRQKTRRTIDSQEAGGQKKHKNNIMYLAFQAQEQEDKLSEMHANRQRAKKAARSKYGY